MATHEELSGVFDRTRWVSADGDYVIGFLESGTVVKGSAEPAELQPGIAYRFFGKWVNDPNYGQQFAFICHVKDLPHSREAVVQYILRAIAGHRTGIGEVTAGRMFDQYHADAVRKLRMEPAMVAAEIGCDLAGATKAAEILQRDARLEDSKIELMGLFAGGGFHGATIQEAIDRWGIKAPSLVRRDAFLLMTQGIKGSGFSRCDTLYLKLGGDPARLKRQALCAWWGLRNDGAGHTWHRPEVAVKAIRAKIAGTNKINPIKAMRLARRAGMLAVHRENGNTWLADATKAKNERIVARIVGRMMHSPSNWPAVHDMNLSLHQQEQLAQALTGQIAILAGTPGTGKTYTAAAVIQAIVAAYTDGDIAIVAPTGKAAVRTTETMIAKGLALRGRTIHRLLEPRDPENGHGSGEWGFAHDENSPLDEKFIIVDEASMLDVDLFASLLRACRPSTHILLVGDPYQLPPVGHGAPLRDMIQAGVPCGLLTEIRRNSGLIVFACRAIKEGTRPMFAQRFDGPEVNLVLTPASDGAAVVNELQRIYQAAIAGGRRNVFEDIQVLTPLNKQSPVSREKLNTFLQRLCNPTGETVNGSEYRVGDKVICLDNGHYPTRESAQVKAAVYNGEQGRVSAISVSHVEFSFPDTGEGPRELKIPVKGDKAKSFTLGYAITVHKSQGSQWPVVVVIADEAAGRVASRELWYTAASRASERCIILGRSDTVSRQCKRISLRDRKTFLVEMLAENAPVLIPKEQEVLV
ncbi:MAG: hypothetical protein A3E01_02905 [Gammaproteobacteria bacterium RIFCSPHIGHO2_12_FULL_63_22]|nr:MAG: hypothetical protein A3E01_02905 [Gammaproteobacteria bacterium RIFCSPHIGHO2_12_FULL_63_22]